MRRKIVIGWHWILKRWCAHIIIVIIVQIPSASKVRWSFVFMSSSILFHDQHQPSILREPRWEPHVLKSANGLVDIARREIVQLFVMAKYDDGNIDGTKNG